MHQNDLESLLGTIPEVSDSVVLREAQILRYF